MLFGAKCSTILLVLLYVTQIAVNARLAVKYYISFINSFETDGKLPDRIDSDNERFFIGASFSLGRCLHHAADKKGIDYLERACERLRWVVEYVKKFEIQDFEGEARLAEELAGLISEKLAMVKRQQY